MRRVSAADIGGPSLFQTKDDGRSITNAPLTFALLASRLSGVLASIRTTAPRTVLAWVPGAHAQLAAMTSCARGATGDAHTGPGVHAPRSRLASDRRVCTNGWHLC